MRPAAVDINQCIPGLSQCDWMLQGTNADAIKEVTDCADTLHAHAAAKARLVLHPLVEFLRERLEELLAESVRPFGSHEYALPLVTSDIDVQVTLKPGTSVAEGMLKLWNVAHSHTDLCTGLPQ